MSVEPVLDHAEPTLMPRLRTTTDDARHAAVPPGQLSALLLSHGSMELRWYAPGAVDVQTPHDRDELYVVVTGTGVFVRAEGRVPFPEEASLDLHGQERVSVQAGDTLFVPAGAAHRFEATSPDFGAWIVFYGPEGGEAA